MISPKLKEIGIKEIFEPGAKLKDITEWVRHKHQAAHGGCVEQIDTLRRQAAHQFTNY